MEEIIVGFKYFYSEEGQSVRYLTIKIAAGGCITEVIFRVAQSRAVLQRMKSML